MKALITGGAGFIGSRLAEELLSRSHQVIANDDLSTGKADNIAHIKGNPGFDFHYGSIMAESDLSDLIEQADCTYHLAAAVGVIHVLEHLVTALETKARGTSNVLRLAQ
jgi:UDP-glucose 4-epimerase